MAAHLDRVAQLGCCICGGPANIHHVLGGSIVARMGCRGNRKHCDWLTIPLCHRHHQGDCGIHQIGVETWEERYGTQAHFIDELCEQFGLNLWDFAIDARTSRRRYKRLDKILPR